jgi:hypothetical protein
MPNERVSIFISHKVTTHKRAAQKIKDILEARPPEVRDLIRAMSRNNPRWGQHGVCRLLHRAPIRFQVLYVFLVLARDRRWRTHLSLDKDAPPITKDSVAHRGTGDGGS